MHVFRVINLLKTMRFAKFLSVSAEGNEIAIFQAFKFAPYQECHVLVWTVDKKDDS